MGNIASTIGSSAIARRFLAVRLNSGLSQKDFADTLDISLRAEQNYERGARKIPAEVHLHLAKKHGIDPLWLMEGPGEIPRKILAATLDATVLAKASALVRSAISSSGKKVSERQLWEWVSQIYSFYMTNADAKGTEDLIRALIGNSR